ncbi:hypothetical protein DYBT9275_05782 [Dyadobacter sp. CECT 9275]|uniref:SRPBCC domain-containing protein n=1 Tax=Dyadobacter helix TaxID=2822344 RepID=A0A916NE51_9BACT|nr:SRPBCC domain-containing protein [Dyadobacter sp. CECT 9275]CAG5017485.1 hypothetical protein DYBT9275_05782 [Dyadobacter sp. CECT 9275]
MEKKRIKKSITIDASKEKVWDVLMLDNYNSIWYACFSEGTVAVTDWQVGSKVIFKDGSENGLIGTVMINEPSKMLSVTYTGMLEGGKEDYESEAAKDFAGSEETYVLSENNNVTTLDISVDMGADYFDMMTEAWDHALVSIKELSENKN